MKSAVGKVEELRDSVRLLMSVADTIRQQRMGLGALELESDEMSVTLDSHRKSVVDLIPKAGLEIHHTIAECMIFANRAVAERITQTFPRGSLLRRHPPPREQHFERLVQAAAARGHTIDVRTNDTLAQSLNTAIDPADPEYVPSFTPCSADSGLTVHNRYNRALRKMATAAMSEAEYFDTGTIDADQWFHYGLAVPHYTHFTSPIRRYASTDFGDKYGPDYHALGTLM